LLDIQPDPVCGERFTLKRRVIRDPISEEGHYHNGVWSVSGKSSKKSGGNRKQTKSSPARRKVEGTAAASPDNRRLGLMVLGVVVAIAAISLIWRMNSDRKVDEEVKVSSSGPVPPAPAVPGELLIDYPANGTMFPPEISAPTFRWTDTDRETDRWLIEVRFDGEEDKPFRRVVETSDWKPPLDQWEAMKLQSVEQPATISVSGYHHSNEDEVITSDTVDILTSVDEVGAPIFYREVNMPFSEAVRDPAAHIRWLFGEVSSSEKPKVVLEKMPVCGNCHSFSKEADYLGMDVDFASDKGSYSICPVNEKMLLARENIISWADYRKEDGKKTFGLLAQISPDGRYVVGTVKDLSVFLALDDNLAFSQLFFPIQGILCVYDSQTGEFEALPGADDPEYVQSNPTWSPDGSHIVFARSKAHTASETRENELGLSRPEEAAAFLSGEEKFLFDLYRIPFNEGKGGVAEPLPGASQNGKSNYFAKYSPDGKWIVFCQAESFMLLQPDSELFIVPAEGGEARRMECNTSRMNSWHSWSPNNRWLVFSSKAHSIYTQLFLTHIDEQGRSTPPVVLSHFTASDRAANIPEFVNTGIDAIERINFDSEFFRDALHINAGDKLAGQGQFDLAIEEFKKAIVANPDNIYAYRAWALVLRQRSEFDEAEGHLREALRRAPDDRYVHWQLGQILAIQSKQEEAERHLRYTIEIDPGFMPPYRDLGYLLIEIGRNEEGQAYLREAERFQEAFE
jgi:tetratricopeptide (TPR) repeat protein